MRQVSFAFCLGVGFLLFGAALAANVGGDSHARDARRLDHPSLEMKAARCRGSILT